MTYAAQRPVVVEAPQGREIVPVAARRGHNEGSIYQRGDGRWCTAITVGYEDGKQKRKVIYGKTRKEVAEKLKIALRDQQQGLPIAVGRQTVGQFLDQWLETVVRQNTRPRTQESYAQVIRLYLVPAIGRQQLAKLEPQHVQAMMNALLARGLSPRTVVYVRAILRKALNQAIRWGLTARNVATLVDPPKTERFEAVALTPEQAIIFLATVKGDRLEALYAVALSLGLRQGEALGLRWQDVDLDSGTLHVRAALSKVGGKLVLAEPKTSNSRRTLPLPDELIVALRAHRTRQNEERLRLGAAWKDHGLVFPSTIGTPISPRNLIRSFQSLRERAGLPSMRFHDLRHSCLSLLAAQGVPARTAMEIAGHSQITLTLNVYTHANDSGKRTALAGMGRLFASAI